MKIYFFCNFKDSPWGGGNQFLKALRQYFRRKGVYAEQADDAEAVLFNSHQFGKNNLFLFKLWKLVRSRPDIIVLHRVDGPIFMVRGQGFGVDKVIFRFNELVVDGTVFQSEWSKAKNLLSGMPEGTASTVVMNAPDSSFFHSEYQIKLSGKVKIIATSWSSNPRKGFDVYQYLDRHLDWNRYEMTFVGNSPVSFNRVRHLPPVESIELASILRQHDIFLTASQHDPCSNSLIEALHCGIPAVGLNSGGNPEIIGKGGELFEGEEDVLSVIDQVSANLEFYRQQITVPTIAEVGDAYYRFAEEVTLARRQGKISKKRFSISGLFELISRSAWCNYGFLIERKVLPHLPGTVTGYLRRKLMPHVDSIYD